MPYDLRGLLARRPKESVILVAHWAKTQHLVGPAIGRDLRIVLTYAVAGVNCDTNDKCGDFAFRFSDALSSPS
jgi:hypothetical protein